MRNKLIRFLFLGLSFVFPLSMQSGGNAKADSLLNLLKTHQSKDTTKAMLYYEYGRCFLPMGMDSAQKYFDLGHTLSVDLGFSRGIIKNLNGQGSVLLYRSQPDKARMKFMESRELAKNTGDPDFLALINNNIGVTFDREGNLDSSEKYHLIALDYAKKLNSGKRLAKILSDLASNNSRRGNYEKALKFNLQAKEVLEREHSLPDLLTVYIRLGVIYSEIKDYDKSLAAYHYAIKLNDTLGNPWFGLTITSNLGFLYYRVKKNYDTAVYYYQEAISTSEKLNAQDVLLTSLINIGGVYFAKKEYKKALEYFLLASKSPALSRMNFEKTGLETNLGSVYLSLGNLSLAEKYLKQGLKSSIENHYLEFQKEAYSNLIDLELERKNYKVAMEYTRKFHLVKDSLWSKDKEERIARLEFASQLNRRAAQYEALKRKTEQRELLISRQRVMGAAAGLVLLLLIVLLGVMVRNRNKIKAMNKALDEKNKKLEELNQTKDKFFSIISHDLRAPFNALLGLLAEMDENYNGFDEETKKRLIHNLRSDSDKTYNLLVNLLEWSQMQRVPKANTPEDINLKTVVTEIMEVLDSRASMKKQQMIDEINQDQMIYADPMVLKSMLINLVNNAIKFTPEGGRIIVSHHIENDFHIICVTDNGIGIPGSMIPSLFRLDNEFRREGTNQEAGTGLGLVMCKEYAESMGGTITVESAEGEGSRFCFSVPVKQASKPSSERESSPQS